MRIVNTFETGTLLPRVRVRPRLVVSDKPCAGLVQALHDPPGKCFSRCSAALLGDEWFEDNTPVKSCEEVDDPPGKSVVLLVSQNTYCLGSTPGCFDCQLYFLIPHFVCGMEQQDPAESNPIALTLKPRG